jgi:hypothetical protein
VNQISSREITCEDYLEINLYRLGFHRVKQAEESQQCWSSHRNSSMMKLAFQAGLEVGSFG